MEINKLFAKANFAVQKQIFIKYFPIILLVIILVLGAYLRLYRIQDYMTFLGDEGRDVLVVKRMLIDHKFTLLGPTASVGGFFLGRFITISWFPFYGCLI